MNVHQRIAQLHMVLELETVTRAVLVRIESATHEEIQLRHLSAQIQRCDEAMQGLRTAIRLAESEARYEGQIDNVVSMFERSLDARRCAAVASNVKPFPGGAA